MRQEKIVQFAKKVEMIGRDLAGGLLHHEVATKHEISIGVVRFIAEQIGWDSSWAQLTQVESQVFDLLAQGFSLTQVRTNLGTNLETVLRVARRCGLNKQARRRLSSKRPLVQLNERQVTSDEVQAKHWEKWKKAVELWNAGQDFRHICLECHLLASELLAGVEEMRCLYGWFSPRPADEEHSRYLLRKRAQDFARRKRWIPAEKLWDLGFNADEIACMLDRDVRLVKTAIKTCQQTLGMFKKRLSCQTEVATSVLTSQ